MEFSRFFWRMFFLVKRWRLFIFVVRVLVMRIILGSFLMLVSMFLWNIL